MKQFIAEIENNELFDYYLIYGEENYLVNKCSNTLLDHLVSACNDINTLYIKNDKIEISDIDDIIAFDETIPFMSEYRLVVFTKCNAVVSGNAKNSTAIKELIKYLETKTSNTKYVFIENEIDKKSSLYKFVNSNGRVIELGVQSDNALSSWLRRKFESKSVNISSSCIHHILQLVGNNMQDLDNESDKLISFKYNDSSEVTIQDIDSICTHNITNRIYDMIKYISMNNKSKALDIYMDLIEIKEDPMHILALLNMEFKKLLIVKSAVNNQLTNSEIMSKLRENRGWLVNNYIKLVPNFTITEIKNAMSLLIDIDQKCKTGILDMKYCVELFVSSICK